MIIHKKKITEIILGVLTVVGACGGFWAIGQIPKGIDASTFIVPTAWFSLFFISFGLLSMIALRREVIAITIGIALFTSFFFSLSLMHFLIIIFAAMIVFLGAWEVRKDRTMSLHMHAGKSVRAGLSLMVIGVSLTIASQYYWTVRETTFDDLFDRAVEQSTFSNIADATVRGAVEEQIEEQVGGRIQDQKNDLAKKGSTSLSVAEAALGLRRGVIEEFVQESGLKNVGDAVQESFDETLKNALPKQFSPTAIMQKQLKLTITEKFPRLVTFFAELLSLMVFLSALSVGSLMRFLWLPITQMIFLLLKFVGVVEIRTVSREAETIV